MEDRGRQSWGYSDGERIIKRLGTFRSGGGPGLFGSASALLHTRQATTGDKTAGNSHPFDIKGIIGCHNGMIYNHKAAAEKFGIKYEVDSELIFHLLADGTALTELEGYGTIAYYQNGKMHLGRFSNRGDLAVAKTELGWVFASTKSAVEDATGIAGIKVDSWQEALGGTLYQIDGDQFIPLPTSLAIGEMKPTTGFTSWQDFNHGGSEGYTSGFGAYAGSGVYKGGHWDRHAGKWVDHGDPKLLPLPTPETTTFASEPETDADEVIDVSDAANEAYMDAAATLSGRFVTGDFNEMDWIETTPFGYGINNVVRCDECMEKIGKDDPLFVEPSEETFICETCFSDAYDDDVMAEDAEDEETLNGSFTRDVIAEMCKGNLLHNEFYGLEEAF